MWLVLQDLLDLKKIEYYIFGIVMFDINLIIIFEFLEQMPIVIKNNKISKNLILLLLLKCQKMFFLINHT